MNLLLWDQGIKDSTHGYCLIRQSSASTACRTYLQPAHFKTLKSSNDVKMTLQEAKIKAYVTHSRDVSVKSGITQSFTDVIFNFTVPQVTE